MITIVRGPREALDAHVGAMGDPVRLDLPAGTAPGAWSGLCALLEGCRARLGDDRVTRAVTARRTWLSLAVPSLTATLTEDERRERAERSGTALAELPNVAPRRGPIVRAWAETFGELVSGQDLSVAVAELDRIDLASLGSLRAILRRCPGLRIGVGEGPPHVPADPARALIRARKVRELRLLEALPEDRVAMRLLGPGAGREDPPEVPGGPEACDLDALRAAFDGFAFDVALVLATALAVAPELDPAMRRFAHGIAALSIHHLDPTPRPEAWACTAYEHHLTRALEGEDRASARAHWRYRLTLLEGRTKRRLEAALVHADLAVQEAREAQTNAPLLEAWGRNGRAYVQLRAGRPEEAARDLEAAIALLDGSGASDVEIDSALVLLHNNRARVAALSGDRAETDRWRARTATVSEKLAPADRPDAQWSPPPQGDRDLVAAREFYARELALAQDRLDPQIESWAAHALGVLAYRTGDASTALASFRTALRIFRIVGADPADIQAEVLNQAVAAFRCRSFTEAGVGFDALLADCLDDGARAEISAARAWVAAAARELSAPDALDAAVRLGEACGSPGAFARVLRSVAEGLLELGDRGRALRMVERALAIGELEPDDRFALLMTALEAAPSGARLLEALEAVAPALGDPNSGWELGRLLRHVARARHDGSLTDIPLPPARGLDMALEAAGERIDTAAAAAAIRARAPDPQARRAVDTRR